MGILPEDIYALLRTFQCVYRIGLLTDSPTHKKQLITPLKKQHKVFAACRLH